MVAVLSIIAALCGLLLAAVKKGTEKRIEEQILMNVQGPALEKVLASSTNDIIGERQQLMVEGEQRVIFIGKKDGKPWAIAFETVATGYKGKIGVMVGFDLESNIISGIGILTHQETPGLGARISETAFTDNFKGKSIDEAFKVKQDGGNIDGVSGATISSRAVCSAVAKAISLYSAVLDKAIRKPGE